MGDGFKIADAFVDVAINLNESDLEQAGGRAGAAAGNALAGEMDSAGGRGGERFARSFDSSSEARMRDARGRFVSSFEGISDSGGKSSGSKFGGSFGGSLLGKVTGAAGKMGGLLTDTLSSVGSAGGPKMMVGMLAAVGTAAPLAGAILGGALTAGVAMAGIGIGVAAAMRQPVVKSAAQGLKSMISEQLDKIGQDWTPTMLGAIDRIKGQIPGIGANLRQALLPAQGYVAPLVDGFLGLIRNVLPGFNNLLREAGPVVNVLKNGLMQIGDALGEAFTTMSGSTDEMAAGLQLAMFLLSKGIVFAGQMVSWLAQGAKYVLDFITPLVGLAAKLPGVGDTFKTWHDELKGMQATAHGVNPAMQNAGQGMTAFSSTASLAAQISERMALRQRILTSTMADGAEAAGDLKTAMDALNGAAQSAEEAEIGFRESVKRATDAIKDNGRTTDLNTEKGQANRRALLELARAGQQRAQAQYDQTAATRGTTAAEGAAQNAYSASRNQLIATAQKMGMSAGEARRYADRIMAIPKMWNTTVRADTGAASSNVTALQRKINSLRGKTIAINVRVNQHGEMLRGNQASAFMSRGGPVSGPGPKGVDSEVRVLAPGEHVMSAREVDAAGGHRAVEAWRRTLRGESASAPAAAVMSSTAREPSGSVINIGTVTLDASSIRGIGDVVRLVEDLTITARAHRARVATAPGV